MAKPSSDTVIDYSVMPPIVTPITDRAKEFLGLPSPATGMILIGDDDDVAHFMASFPKDWTMQIATDELEYDKPTMICIMSMEKISLQ